MSRPSAGSRDRSYALVQAACARLGLPFEEDGARRLIRISPERRLRLSGGGGVGVLICEALEEDGTVDTRVPVTVNNLVARLARVAATRG
jgi:hypothetical protein